MRVLFDAVAPLYLGNTDDDEELEEKVVAVRQGKLDELPSDVFCMSASLLSARSLFSLSLVSNKYYTLLRSQFQSSFMAMSNIGRFRTSEPLEALFMQTLNSIQTVRIRAQQPALLRALVLTIPDGNRSGSDDRHGHRHLAFFKGKAFSAVLSEQESVIKLPPCSLSQALDLVNLIVARYAIFKSFEHCKITPFNLLQQTEKSFWVAVLNSLTEDIPAYDLKDAITLFFENYDGLPENISDLFAGALASALFFNKKHQGDMVQAIMRRRFGVTTDKQWSIVDQRIASELHEHCKEAPGPDFDLECSRWRACNTRFVIQAEQATLAIKPHYNFGERAQIDVLPIRKSEKSPGWFNRAFHFLNPWHAYANPVKGPEVVVSALSIDLEKFPGRFICALANLLPARSIFTLSLVSKPFYDLLRSQFQSIFTAISKIESFRTGTPVRLLFIQAITSIEAVRIVAQQPGLLRALVSCMSVRNKSISDHWKLGNCDNFDGKKLYEVISGNEARIGATPQKLSEAIALIDLVVARHIASGSFEDCAVSPLDLLKRNDKAFWPEMLYSLINSIPYDMLRKEIQLFAEEFDGTLSDIPQLLACELASALFFRSKLDGEAIRARMQTHFGLNTLEQKSEIDIRIARELHLKLPSAPGAAFDEQCSRWRPYDPDFVILAEYATTEIEPGFDFGERAMIGDASTIEEVIYQFGYNIRDIDNKINV
ncbi:hypothetical protein JOE11_000322 [Robbsia andropogonis]|uniref:F-box protein n=1 Tax=Robbsia andropogonis TaxID=28092 RepID=UPI003D229DD0